MYYLNSNQNQWGPPPSLVIVGIGGTGGYVAESLCRLVDHNIDIILVDMDRVEERNLTRQNFFPEDIGKIKSEAMATRLSGKYNRQVGYSTSPIASTPLPARSLLVGCVDNGIARADITKRKGILWWVDSGNGEDYGQILIGNGYGAEFDEKNQICYELPLPVMQRPELLLQTPPIPAPNCAEIPDQGPVINQIMSSWIVEVVRRIIAGKCPWMQLLVNMEQGTTQPVMADPNICRKMFEKNKKIKITMRGET